MSQSKVKAVVPLKPLDLGQFPLSGHSLIEASAGTGKTYTIAELYQRCLMGHRHPMKLLGCHEILLVTFTRAATDELRGRIRATVRLHLDQLLRLQQRIQHSEQSPAEVVAEYCPSDPQLARWHQWLLESGRADGDSLTHLIEWLQVNLAQMDEAAIFTIHGFCQRMLKQFAFDSGILFDAELVLDSEQYLQHACEDIWRQQGYPLDLAAAQFVRQVLGTPEGLQTTYRSWLGQLESHFRSGEFPLDSSTAHWSDSLTKVQQLWLSIRQQLQDLGIADCRQLIEQSGVSKRSYSSRNLGNWLAGLNAFFEVDEDYLQPEVIWVEAPTSAVEKFRQTTLIDKTEKGEAPRHSIFEQLDEYCQCFNQCRGQLIYQWYVAVQARFIELLQASSSLTPDDLLRLLSEALKQDETGRLAQQIRHCYPVAMIDEFQDTDATQYQIFTTIYPPQSETDSSDKADNTSANEVGLDFESSKSLDQERDSKHYALVLIGDPKQAIYRFRGADIYTYLAAKQAISVDARFTLTTNFRSQPALVEALNAFWSNCDNPFLDDAQIPFQPVASGRDRSGSMLPAEQATASEVSYQELLTSLNTTESTNPVVESAAASAGQSPQQLVEIQTRHAVQVFEDANKANKSSEQTRIAEQCAQHIAALLSGQLAGPEAKSIQARDIAILVYSSREAAIIRQALTEQQIGSVFLSRDSVFETQEAEDLLIWMQAIASAGDDYRIRSALLTPTHGMTAHELVAINHDEERWEVELQRFSRYSQSWQKQGIMAAIIGWLSEDNRAVWLRQQENGERRLTNLLHLGEILQQASRQYPGQQGLIRCLSEHLQQSRSGHDEAQLRLESDSNLVQVVTIHKSKGLEYPHVFLPFLWGNSYTSNRSRGVKVYQYFDERQGPVIQIGDEDSASSRADFAKEQQQKDSLAEWLRLIYVAMTRAREHLYIWLSNSPEAANRKQSMIESSAIGYLLKQCHPDSIPDSPDTSSAQLPNQILDRLSKNVSYCSWQQTIGEYLQQANLDIADNGPADGVDHPQLVSANAESAPITAAVWARSLVNSWRVTSFSALTAMTDHSHVPLAPTDDPSLNFDQEARLPRQWESAEASRSVALTIVNDLTLGHVDDVTDSRESTSSLAEINRVTTTDDVVASGNETSQIAEDASATEPASLAQTTARDFERGAQAGTCLHGIFEYWDFQTIVANSPVNKRLTPKSEALSTAIEQQLMQYGYSPEQWQPGLSAWLQEVVNYPMQHAFGQCCLSDIDPQRRLDELEFCLPLGQVKHAQVNQLIMQGNLSFSPITGYLKGFIDLIFEHQGRYFVLDYKSNQLAETPAEYDQETMKMAMASHHYDAQAWIYTLALDQLLANRLADYDPERHLGGVFYSFIRGMVGAGQTMPDTNQSTVPDINLDQSESLQLNLPLSTDSVLDSAPIDQSIEQQLGVYYIAPDTKQLARWKEALLAGQESTETSKGCPSL